MRNIILSLILIFLSKYMYTQHDIELHKNGKKIEANYDNANIEFYFKSLSSNDSLVISSNQLVGVQKVRFTLYNIEGEILKKGILETSNKTITLYNVNFDDFLLTDYAVRISFTGFKNDLIFFVLK